MIYTVLCPDRLPNLFLITIGESNGVLRREMAEWCIDQDSNGKFDYSYINGAHLPPVWFFTEEKDAILFALRWL